MGYKLYFWDFDGVIKDSVDVKTQAYFQLFEPFGLDVAERVRQHHEAMGVCRVLINYLFICNGLV